MTPDEYRELQIEARDALTELLRHTEPGTGLYLHTALAQLKSNIAEGDKTETTPPLPPAAPTTTYWKREYSSQYRDREVLALLTDHQLTKREVLDHIRAAHPDMWVSLSTTDAAVNRLYLARELDRIAEPTANKRTRYRYFKRTTLEGPIADLQRALDEEAS